MDQASAVQTGCCMDQAVLVAEGFGLPQRSRQAAAVNSKVPSRSSARARASLCRC